MNVFTRNESKEFLDRRVPSITEAEADKLAEEFGDLPLGLEQAGAWLVQTAMTVGAYLDLLKEEGSRILEKILPQLITQSPLQQLGACQWHGCASDACRDGTAPMLCLLRRCTYIFGDARAWALRIGFSA